MLLTATITPCLPRSFSCGNRGSQLLLLLLLLHGTLLGSILLQLLLHHSCPARHLRLLLHLPRDHASLIASGDGSISHLLKQSHTWRLCTCILPCHSCCCCLGHRVCARSIISNDCGCSCQVGRCLRCTLLPQHHVGGKRPAQVPGQRRSLLLLVALLLVGGALAGISPQLKIRHSNGDGCVRRCCTYMAEASSSC
jgi:hypothetical protein